MNFHINSWFFLMLSIVCVLSLRTAPTNTFRQAGLFVFNLIFAIFCFGSLQSLLLLFTVLSITYGLAEVRASNKYQVHNFFYTGLIIVLWIFLFLNKDPKLFSSINPFFHYPVKIVGISYMVFRCISYVQESEIAKNRSFIGMVNYVIFFPTLLAGPIERYLSFTKSFANPRFDDLAAMHRIANGFIKKFLIADNLATLGIFDTYAVVMSSEVSAFWVWFSVLFQFLVLYFDFSGYCDIAIGLAKLMGIEIRENFNKPFLAKNIQDFWNRWHISMSFFIKDTFFNPSMKIIFHHVRGRGQFYASLLVYTSTMMLIALWHGTGSSWVYFGATHSAALILFQLSRKYRLSSRFKHPFSQKILTGVSRCITLIFVSSTMLLWNFGAEQSWVAVKKMLFLST